MSKCTREKDDTIYLQDMSQKPCATIIQKIFETNSSFDVSMLNSALREKFNLC